MMLRFVLAVCAKSEFRRYASRFEATHLLSLLDPEDRLYVPPRFRPGSACRLDFEDMSDPSHPRAPTRAHVERILAFGRALPDGARLLVHCMAGISRSTAAALALLVQELSPGRADEAAERLRKLRPEAHPNLLIAAHADELLGAGGAVLAAAQRLRSRNAAIGLSSERNPFR